MAEHTSEPWDVQNKGILGTGSARHEVVQGVNRDGSKNLPRITRMPDLSYSSYANAKRIVACVNACAGINPEAVPDLLAACRLSLERYDYSDTRWARETCDVCRAAITKALKGE